MYPTLQHAHMIVMQLYTDIRSPSHEPSHTHRHHHFVMSCDTVGCDEHDENIWIFMIQPKYNMDYLFVPCFFYDSSG